MKYLKMFLFIFSLNSVFNVHSQILEQPCKEIIYSLNELKIRGSIFLNNIDSLVLGKKCPVIENKTFKYFIINIDKKNNSNSYSIVVEAYKKPFADNKAIGYFKYKNYYFFIYGCNPNSFFK